MLNSQKIYLINCNAFNNAHSTLTTISFRLTLNYVGLMNWLADAADIFKTYNMFIGCKNELRWIVLAKMFVVSLSRHD